MSWSSQTWGAVESVAGSVLDKVDEGTTPGPVKSTASWEPIPEMSVTITPASGRVEIDFETNVRLDPGGAGNTVGGQVRIVVDGVPIPGTLRTLRYREINVADLISAGDHNEVVSINRSLSVTPGQEITITAEWSVTSQTLEMVGTERSLVVKEGVA